MTAWKLPTWLELQSDSDDDEDEAERKRSLRAELRKAKQQQQQQPAAQPAATSSASAIPEPKRRKLDAAETASVLSRAAYEGQEDADTAAAAAATEKDDEEEELPAAFDTSHYGPGGLNGRFEAEDAIEFFAGGESGGGGRFEDAESRDIAKNANALLGLMRRHGLQAGATVLDVGAGTGLMLRGLSEVVAGSGGEEGGEDDGGEDGGSKAGGSMGGGGGGGRVFAIDISSRFCDFLRRRVPKERLHNVEVVKCSAKATCLPPGTAASFACILDVYHHLEYPVRRATSTQGVALPSRRVVPSPPTPTPTPTPMYGSREFCRATRDLPIPCPLPTIGRGSQTLSFGRP